MKKPLKVPTVSEYNDFYRHNESELGPLPLVEKLSQYLPAPARVLDCGAGQGSNSLFLAGQGYGVTAFDPSSRAISDLNKRAVSSGFKIKTSTEEASSQPKSDYNIIICTAMIHHLGFREGCEFLKRMQNHTLAQGLNLVVFFTKNGDFYQSDPETGCYLDREDFEKLYPSQKWKVLEFREAMIPTPNESGVNQALGFLMRQQG